jgi:hypothetical protein
MSQANANFDRVASTTLKNYAGKMADNISNHIPFLGVMKSKGAVKLSGGDSIVLRLLHEFANAQSYSGSDVIDITKQDGISAAEYNWKQTVCPAIIEEIEKARNSGKEAQESLMEDVIMQAELSLEEKMATMLFGDGTGNSGKDNLGLEALAPTDPTTGTLGGINSANESFWRNTTNTSVGSFATGGLTAIQTAIRNTQRGNDMVDLIVTTATIFGYLQTVANGRAEFRNPELADLGFKALKVEGIDFIYDAKCTSDRIYGINSRWTKLYIHSDYNFVTGKFIEPANQDILVAKIKVYSQLATRRRESMFNLSGVTA